MEVGRRYTPMAKNRSTNSAFAAAGTDLVKRSVSRLDEVPQAVGQFRLGDADAIVPQAVGLIAGDFQTNLARFPGANSADRKTAKPDR